MKDVVTKVTIFAKNLTEPIKKYKKKLDIYNAVCKEEVNANFFFM